MCFKGWCASAKAQGTAACEACVDNGCGWCIGQAWCVKDEANICDNAGDHVGEASGQMECPAGIKSAQDAEAGIHIRVET